MATGQTMCMAAQGISRQVLMPCVKLLICALGYMQAHDNALSISCSFQCLVSRCAAPGGPHTEMSVQGTGMGRSSSHPSGMVSGSSSRSICRSAALALCWRGQV